MAEIPTRRTVVQRPLFSCLACGVEVRARIVADVSPVTDEATDSDPTQLTLRGTVVGMEVTHNCVPSVIRTRTPLLPLTGDRLGGA